MTGNSDIEPLIILGDVMVDHGIGFCRTSSSLSKLETLDFFGPHLRLRSSVDAVGGRPAT